MSMEDGVLSRWRERQDCVKSGYNISFIWFLNTVYMLLFYLCK